MAEAFMKAFLRFSPLSLLAACAALIGFGSQAFASGGEGALELYPFVLSAIGFDGASAHRWAPVASTVFVTLVVLFGGLYFRGSITSSGDDVVPSERFSLRGLVEMMLDFVYGMAKDNCGHEYRSFLPLLATLFLVILAGNLSGLIPGLTPATVDISSNLAMGLVVFMAYNMAGFREHGFGYVKQFWGPVAAIGPLFVFIELVSHLSRPFSLSLRLAGNIFADHLILSVFTGLTYVIAPSLLMFFGLIVAGMQSFVFTLLTSIYVSMAISHDH
jgi:F-type H+-transporting ATPase subunit a